MNFHLKAERKSMREKIRNLKIREIMNFQQNIIQIIEEDY